MTPSKTLTILAHGDSDGICSASIVKAALRDSYDEIETYFTHPVGLVNDLREFARGDLVILDVAIDERNAAKLAEYLEGCEGYTIYVDHHPPPLGLSLAELRFDENVVDYLSEASTSELTFKRFNSRLPREYDRVALYGAIADYADVTEWVKESLSRWDKRHIFFEAGILSQGLEGSRKLYDLKRGVVDHLSRNLKPSSHEELVRRALTQAKENEDLYLWVKNNLNADGYVAYVINPPGSLGVAATYVLGVSDLRVGIAAEVRGDIMV
ncbi:MAG: DHH family phosphoesterase, partial [Zestosphaera sp.]